MDWIKIKENYPLSFKAYMMPLLTQKLRENYDALMVERHPQNNHYFFGSKVLQQMIPIPYHRLMYDFFDKWHIFVNTSSIDAEVIHIDKVDGKHQKVAGQFTKKYDSRIKAEFEAFEIAFSMLEKKMPELLITLQNNPLTIVKK